MKYLKDLREESSGNTRLLWHHNYWDGPISGIMLWKGEMCWFQQFGPEIVTEYRYTDEQWKKYKEDCIKLEYDYNEEEDRIEYYRDRHMKVYRLSIEVLEAIEYNHNLFKKYVGDNTDYDINGHRPIGQLRPSSQHGKFYNKRDTHKKVDLILENCEIIGEFYS